MRTFWLLSAALVALSGGLLADTLAVCGNCTGTLSGNQLLVTSTYLTGGTFAATPYTGNPVNTTNLQIPFWNNPSADGVSPALIDGHIANVGDVLAGLATGTNLIGTNLTGTPSTVTPNTGTVINGSYLALTANNGVGGDPVNVAAPTVSGSLVSETNALEFSFTSQATAFNIALLFADSGNDTGVVGQATSFGTYLGNTPGSLSLFSLDSAVSNQTSGTPTTLATNDTLFNNAGTVYGFYATVCYTWTGTTCTASVTYTTGAGNYSTNISASGANNFWLGAIGWNHFALFELANGEEVLGFTDTPWALGNSNQVAGEGDFNDFIIGLSGNVASSAPEPGTIAIMGLGLAVLGSLGRRRLAKK